MLKRIIILGAGYAGIEAALTLQKTKKTSDHIEISIIEKNSYHTLLTELHEVAGNRISEDGIIVPLKDIFKYTDVRLIKDEIQSIDFEKRTLHSESKQYPYDYLILAAGSEPNYYGIPGMQEYSLSLWSFEDAVRVREHIKSIFYKASSETDPLRRKAMLSFVVGGGGFTGVEMIGELALWVNDLCREYDIPRNQVRLVLIEALPKILSNLKDRNIERAMNYLTKKLKVEVLTNSAITRLTSDCVELKSGSVIPTKTLIWTAGVRASCLTDDIELEKGRTCRIHVNEFNETKNPNVYAIGDVSAFISEGHTLPALVEVALQTGKNAAKNIIADIRGKEKQPLKPNLHGVMVSIGSFFAISDIMGYELPRLFSIIMKYMVNVHYLFGIGGFELVIKYLRHEFLDKRQRKFLIEEHYTVRSQTFWLVPLRLFLGYAWLMEGIRKVQEGWLTTAMLAGRPTDANTSASVTETGEKVFRIISDHTPGWYAWIAETFVIPNALLFQILIVLTEIGLGIAFITGTFTFLAGLAALGLNINFLLSTGLYETSWWFIPAAICMLAGAGKAFGVDHYLMPYLMRQWRYIVRNRRLRLFLFR
ncbi:MAG: FAD-dependent oxidoreductase [Clostridia bacterium]|nr:FAD-dependent oxidoreductase [Clostridia bacterium]